MIEQKDDLELESVTTMKLKIPFRKALDLLEIPDYRTLGSKKHDEIYFEFHIPMNAFTTMIAEKYKILKKNIVSVKCDSTYIYVNWEE